MQYIELLTTLFEANANATEAVGMEKYMRNQFPFFGIKSPLRKQLIRQFIAQNGLPTSEQLAPVVEYLWQLPQRDYQYAALTIVEKVQKKKQIGETLTDLLAYMITTRSWWDTVDATHAMVGTQMQRYPEQMNTYTLRWIESENKWLNRMAIIFQLSYGHKTNQTLLFDYIRRQAHHKDFFVQKAIGWALRQYSYANPVAVQQFIEQTSISPLSAREGLKAIKRKEIRSFYNHTWAKKTIK